MDHRHGCPHTGATNALWEPATLATIMVLGHRTGIPVGSLVDGAATNVATESADAVLVKSDPAGSVRALARATYRKMAQNLFRATGYNVVALPLAAGVRRHRAHRQLRERIEQTCRSCAAHGCVDCTCRQPDLSTPPTP